MRPLPVINPVRTGLRLAFSHASSALRLARSSSRPAQTNSVDQIHSPTRIGGMVSGPGSAASARPSKMNSSPETSTIACTASAPPGVRRSLAFHPLDVVGSALLITSSCRTPAAVPRRTAQTVPTASTGRVGVAGALSPCSWVTR